MLFYMKSLEVDLYCSANEAIFRLKEALEPETFSMGYTMAVVLAGAPSNSSMYRNYQKKIELEHRYGNDVTTNVIDSYKEYDWHIRQDTTKSILGHLCFQATAKWQEPQAMSSDSIQRIATVWFAQDIPVPFGPSRYGGLPGLILEISENSTTTHYYALKIDDHYIDKSKILSEPKAQRTTTQAEESKKWKKQMKEAQEWLKTQKH